jgi:glycosyltransferase involved in cell wall biosynthesis
VRFLVIYHANEASARIVLQRLAQQNGCTDFILAGTTKDADIPVRLINPNVWEAGYHGLGGAIRKAKPEVIFNVCELSNFSLWQAHHYRPPGVKLYSYAFDNLCLTPAAEGRLRPGLKQLFRSRIKQLCVRRNAKIVDKIIMSSMKAWRAHADNWNIPESKMALCWFPVLNRDEMMRKLPDVDLAALDAKLKGKTVLGFCGRMIPEKGLGLIARVADHMAPGTHLLMVGSSGPMSGQFVNRPNVTVLPPQDPFALGHIFQRMHVLLVPSRSTFNWEEQFGRVIHEAKNFGLPVLASRSGSIPEFLPEDCLFPEDDLATLSKQLMKLFPGCLLSP